MRPSNDCEWFMRRLWLGSRRIIITNRILHRIRQHIKKWITEWDLERLYPDYRPEIVSSPLNLNYTEMPVLELPEAKEKPFTNGPSLNRKLIYAL